MKQIGVDCRFAIDGTITIQRIKLDNQWQPVGQGRQWVDQNGRHVLIMLPNNQPHQIRLRPDTMTWESQPLTSQNIQVV